MDYGFVHFTATSINPSSATQMMTTIPAYCCQSLRMLKANTSNHHQSLTATHWINRWKNWRDDSTELQVLLHNQHDLLHNNHHLGLHPKMDHQRSNLSLWAFSYQNVHQHHLVKLLCGVKTAIRSTLHPIVHATIRISFQIQEDGVQHLQQMIFSLLYHQHHHQPSLQKLLQSKANNDAFYASIHKKQLHPRIIPHPLWRCEHSYWYRYQ